MSNLKNTKRDSWSLAIIGAIIGFIIALAKMPEQTGSIIKKIEPHYVYIFPIIGALLGFFLLQLINWVRKPAARLGIKKLQLSVPFIGNYTVNMASEQRQSIWNIFVELSTRITTISLHQKSEDGNEVDTGLIREALNSIYSIFSTARSELKTMPPSLTPEGDGSTLESYIFIMLNKVLRPFLSRWHPRLLEWEATAMPEGQWPLAKECRIDLERTRQRMVVFTYQLGKALNVAQLENVLPECPSEESLKTDLNSDERQKITKQQIEKYDREISATLSDEISKAGWRIYVEIIASVPAEPLSKDFISITSFIDQMHLLNAVIRRELKRMTPTPPVVNPPSNTVGSISLKLLRKHLGNNISYWSLQIKQWTSSEKTFNELPELNECFNALEQSRKELNNGAKSLAALVGAPPVI